MRRLNDFPTAKAKPKALPKASGRTVSANCGLRLAGARLHRRGERNRKKKSFEAA